MIFGEPGFTPFIHDFTNLQNVQYLNIEGGLASQEATEQQEDYLASLLAKVSNLHTLTLAYRAFLPFSENLKKSLYKLKNLKEANFNTNIGFENIETLLQHSLTLELIYVKEISQFNFNKIIASHSAIKKIIMQKCAWSQEELKQTKAQHSKIDINVLKFRRPFRTNSSEVMNLEKGQKFTHTSTIHDPYENVYLLSPMKKYHGVIYQEGRTYHELNDASNHSLNGDSIPFHSPQDYLNIVPTSRNFIFKYTKKYKTGSKSQNVIVEQLSQYMTLKKILYPEIYTLQDGICSFLSKWSLNKTPTEWKNILFQICNWDGKKETRSPNLMRCFKELLAIITTHDPLRPIYTGMNQAINIVTTLNTACILSNPWHTVMIFPLSHQQYFYYDPNGELGGFIISDASLLRKTIEQSLGHLIMISDRIFHANLNHSRPAPIIQDKGLFIQNGGLHVLNQATNTNELIPQLKNIKLTSPSSIGLKLRSMAGHTAAELCIRDSRMDCIFSDLLLQCMTHFFKNEWKRLLFPNKRFGSFYIDDFLKKYALDHPELNYLEENRTLTTPTHSQQPKVSSKLDQSDTIKQESDQNKEPENQKFSVEKKTNDDIDSFIRIGEQKPLVQTKPLIKSHFKTWEVVTPLFKNAAHYCQDVISKAKRTLIDFTSTEDVCAFHITLEQTAHDLGRPVFYINSPNDLRTSSSYMGKNPITDRWDMLDGPGGPLYEFLQANKNNKPILIVNYANFDEDEIPQFNALLENDPKGLSKNNFSFLV